LEPFKKLLPPIIILLIIVSIGIFGYSVIENWALLDSVYMVIITLFTVGFQEVQPLSSEGKIFTIFLILIGVGASIYVAGQIIEIIVEGQILGIRRRKKMENTIRNLKDHFIICGFGRVGHQVGKEFDASNIKYVVIDNDPENAKKYEEENIHYIIGDATSDDKLHEAGITTAKGLVACSDSDVANVYVTLSARTLNKDLHIVSRSSKIDTERKLKIAGANRVISPYFISGKRMAHCATKPVASDFLDMVSHGDNMQFTLQEIPLSENSPFIGKTLLDSGIKEHSAITVLAIRDSEGEFNLQPHSTTVINKGDTFLAVGTFEQLEKLRNMV
jgi:voltage-gated potassium channel